MSSSNAYMSDDIQANRAGGDVRALIFLSRFAKPQAQLFIFGFALLLASAITALLGAYFLGRFIASGIGQANYAQAFTFGVLVVVIESCSTFSSYFGRKILANGAGLTVLNIRAALFSQLQKLPLSYFDRQPLGRTVTRITHDVESLEDFFSGSMAKMVVLGLTAIFSMLAMLLTDFKLGAICALAMMPAVLLTQVSRSRSRELNRRISVANSATNARLSEYLNGIQVIRSFGLENWSKDNFDARVTETVESNIRLNEFYCWLRPVVEFCVHLPMLTILFFGGRHVLLGSLNIGVFVAFLRYADRFSRPMSELSREIHMIQQAFTSAERVAVFLRAETEDVELGKNGSRSGDLIRGGITFKDVEMGYLPANKVLRGISFSLLPGEKIGLAGATGSGKTSTVSLLARLYEFQQGKIELDGFDIRSFNRNELRSAIGFISQDVVIFKGTLRDNLDDSHKLSDPEILSACEETGLALVMSRRELSLDELILDKGANLSVGERQLLALTRVLLRQPKILVMDEATANIDPELEKVIHSAVDKLMLGRTTLIVAHRLATLRQCNRLLVFRDGVIVEEGSHDKLVSQNGYYFDLLHGGEFQTA